MTSRSLLVGAYIGVIVLANWLSSRYGLVPAGFGLLVSAGSYSAGLALGLRDWLQDLGGHRWVLAAIAVGVAVSFLVGSGRIAAASAVAFGCSELLDWAVYSRLHRRGIRRAGIVVSNVVGATLDTALFLSLSGLGLTATAFFGQLLVKAVWVTAAFLLADLALRSSRTPVAA